MTALYITVIKKKVSKTMILPYLVCVIRGLSCLSAIPPIPYRTAPYQQEVPVCLSVLFSLDLIQLQGRTGLLENEREKIATLPLPSSLFGRGDGGDGMAGTGDEIMFTSASPR